MGGGYDIIVVGARCVGAPAARLLARRGLEVLLMDRPSFPSEIPHGHFTQRGGPRLLRDWQPLKRITAAGGTAVTTLRSIPAIPGWWGGT